MSTGARHLTPATVCSDARDIVGESIIWDDRRSCLFWVDIVGRKVQRLDPATGAQRTWIFEEFVTSIGLRKDGGAILGLTKTVALWDFESPPQTIATMESDWPDNRLNEGKVAPDGSFWVGTMQTNLNPDGSPRSQDRKRGYLYRVDASGSVARLSDDPFWITNTMVWLEDGRFVTADTVDNMMFEYDVANDGKLIRGRRPFSKPVSLGLPDGSCRDADGGIWTCRVVGGAAIIRTLPNGTVNRIIRLPCSWPTSCTFGGPDLDILYITSARFTMSAEHQLNNPQEGAVFSLSPGVRGVPEHRYGPISARA